MSELDFADKEMQFETDLREFIEACETVGFDPTERILDVLYNNGIEV
jgi:hypothetical protein